MVGSSGHVKLPLSGETRGVRSARSGRGDDRNAVAAGRFQARFVQLNLPTRSFCRSYHSPRRPPVPAQARVTPRMPTPAKLQGIFTPQSSCRSSPRRDQRAGAAPLHRLADRARRARAVSQRLDGRVHALHARGAAADHRHHGRPDARPRADSGRGRRSQRSRDDPACEYYHSLGVRAVAIVSPYYYKLSPPACTPTFARSADNTPVDVTLYNIPMFASPIDVPTVQRLSEEFERDRGDQGFVGRLAAHDSHDHGRAPNRPDFAFLPAGTRR